MALDNAETPAGLSALQSEYEILGELGRGGMAVVYRARDRVLRRDVAVKVIRARYVEDEEALARFAREARTVAKLQHPSIVSVHSVHKLGEKGVALVMQYVPGRTLKEALREDGPFTPERAQQVLHDIADALGYAHQRGIIHRDIKPENIFLDERSGRALLSDFGIAISLDSDTQLTLTGTAIGTPTYMSPEQVDGAPLDGRSDLYSLGLVGWEMLTGQKPWEGEGLYSIIYKQKHEELPRLRDLRGDLPARLVFTIEGALRKDREGRWQSAEEFVTQLVERSLAAKRRRWSEARRRSRPAAVPIPPADAPEEGSTPDDATLRYRRSDPVEPPRTAQPHGEPVWLTRQAVRTASVLLLLVASAALVWAVGSQNQPPQRAEAAEHTPLPEQHPPPDTEATTVAGATEPALEPVDSAELPSDAAPLQADGSAGGGESPALAEPQVPAPAALPPTPRSTAASSSPAADSPSARPVAPPATAPAAAPAAGDATAARSESARSSRVTAIVAGGVHTCILDASGAAHCWGANDRGQLGNRSTQRHAAPAQVSSEQSFTTLAAGLAHTCGLTAAGEVYCWGANDAGQLGDGTTGTRTNPTRVAGDLRLRRVWTGSAHTCGVTAGGEAYCWGRNSSGQLGDGSTSGRTTPVRVGGPAFTALAVGWSHTCGLSRQGNAYCWGSNAEGQLGAASEGDHASPAAVGGELRFASIAAGSAHTCAVTAGGELYCWGTNAHGQLADGSGSRQPLPVRSGAAPPFASVTAGSLHSCALTRSGEAYCWGRNSFGQLGDGTTTDRATPVRVQGNYRFTSLYASGAHTCGTTSAGQSFCWGYNVEGQLGDGTRGNRTRPVSVGSSNS